MQPVLNGMVYIVDDDASVRDGLAWLLRSRHLPSRAFDSAEAFDAMLQAGFTPTQPCCLLLDVRMPGMSGLDLHDRLLQAGVHVPIVYMTGHGDVPLAVQAMQRGAVSFLEKPFAEDALEAALQRAFSTPAAAEPEAEPDTSGEATEWQRRLARLTPRERELLGWVIEDKLNKTIADLMGISIKTVELHRKRVMEKLGASSATHLIKMVVSERVV